MARVRVVLQSRYSSSRLPGKALRPVAGHPMVALAALRAGNTGLEVVVATSTEPSDDAVAAAAAPVARVVRGSLEDPLARFVLATADLDPADVVVRLTADNVVPDGTLVGWLASSVGPSCAYARLGGDDPAVPYGVAAEAFTVGALREAAASTDPFDREHVTPRIKAVHGDNRLEVPSLRASWAGLRCTVDTPADYAVVRRLFADVPDPVGVSWRDLADRLARQHSRLVLGTVQLGLPYGAANTTGQPSPQQARALLVAARDAGVTQVDTARAYGTSEEAIGAAEVDLGVVTKLAPGGSLASYTESLAALRRTSVDALLVHRAADWAANRDELAEVDTVVGASLSTPAELLELLADPRCGYVQLPFNLLDRRWLEPEVQAGLAARPDVTVAVRSAYLQGLLVSDAARWPAGQASVLGAVDELVATLGRSSRADLCLAYVLAHPWVRSVVVGAETPGQITESARLVGQTPLQPDEVALLQSRLSAGAEDLVDPSRWS